MPYAAREDILGKLKKADRREEAPARPPLPPLTEVGWGTEQLIEKFTENLALQTGVVHRVADRAGALEKLTEIAQAEGWKAVMIATDEVLAPLDLAAWGRTNGIDVLKAADFTARDAFKDAVFDQVDAGITGVDWAVAETGTVALVHDDRQPRLVSLAPILHVVVVPVDRILPVYEQALERILAARGGMPAHLNLITGPSMTADIQATPFKGMHGPRRVIALLIG
ncbi:MAG: lactate utilization protein [Syntrophales bacterium]|jgi:L-lactate dehydrogenase complex protein LldG|nr:lactate utilization protein [Syntrophales bacterium]